MTQHKERKKLNSADLVKSEIASLNGHLLPFRKKKDKIDRKIADRSYKLRIRITKY